MTRLGRTALLTLLAAAPAFAADDAGTYKDEKYQFTLKVAKPWTSAQLAGYTVPGVARAAWSGEKNSSIVVFVQEPGKDFSPRFLLDASAESMKAKLAAKIVAQEIRSVGGMKAMWLIVSAPGTGGAIIPSGQVDTTQHWVAIPREKDIVVVLLTTPTDGYEALKPSFEKTVADFEIQGTQTDEQKNSK